MSTFVLVHGAWHGAWCWYRVVAGLESAGHHVVTVDLPGHGTDHTPLEDCTLERYVAKVVDVIAQQDEPVVLVGHSLGGLTITHVAEHVPEQIQTLVYVTAVLLPSGSTFWDLGTDPGTVVLDYLEEAGDANRISDEGLRESCYALCSDDDVALARLSLVWEPTSVLGEVIRTTPERFGSVPRAYIECSEDRTVSLGWQRKMHEQTPCDPVITIKADHSPFFSAPTELVEHLASFATTTPS